MRALVLLLVILVGLGSLSHVHAYWNSSFPDLVLSNVWIGDAKGNVIHPTEGNDFYFWSGVSNLDPVAVHGYSLVVSLDGNVLGSFSSGDKSNSEISYYAGYNSWLAWSWGPVRISVGSHNVTWEVNPDRTITESDYSNNVMTLLFTVRAFTSPAGDSGPPPMLGMSFLQSYSVKGGDALAVDRFARHIVVGSRHSVSVFAYDGELLWSRPMSGFGVTSVAVSPDGSLVATADQGTLELFSINGTLLWSKPDGPGSVSFSSDGTGVLDSWGGLIVVHDLSGKVRWHFSGSNLRGLSTSENGRYVAFVGEREYFSDQGTFVSLLSGNGTLVWSRSIGDHRLTTSAVNNNGDVWVGDDWGYLHLFNSVGDSVWTEKLGTGPLDYFGMNVIAADPLGGYAALGTQSGWGIVRMISLSGQIIDELGLTERFSSVTSLAVSQDGAYILANSWETSPVLISTINARSAINLQGQRLRPQGQRMQQKLILSRLLPR